MINKKNRPEYARAIKRLAVILMLVWTIAVGGSLAWEYYQQSTKIEAGQLNVEITDCSLGQLLNSLESMMKPQAMRKSLDFRIAQGNDLPSRIQSDPHRLQQCLINLVNNALKFTDQGYVHIQISMHEDKGKHFIRFDVEDTGIGIPEDRQEAIFGSFTQADNSTTRKYGGTGLGLAVTKQLVELLGGELTVSSELGKGYSPLSYQRVLKSRSSRP